MTDKIVYNESMILFYTNMIENLRFFQIYWFNINY